jgi:hypothetical protein
MFLVATSGTTLHLASMSLAVFHCPLPLSVHRVAVAVKLD